MDLSEHGVLVLDVLTFSGFGDGHGMASYYRRYAESFVIEDMAEDEWPTIRYILFWLLCSRTKRKIRMAKSCEL